MPENKIVFVYNTAAYLIRFRSELIKAFQDRGFACHAVLPKSITDEELDTLSTMGVHAHLLNCFVDQRISPLSDIRLTIEYYKLFRKLQPALVFNFTIKPSIYSTLAARFARVRTIATMITGLGYVFMDTNLYRRCISFVARLLYRLALRGSAKVFFQNSDDLQYFVSHGIVLNGQSHLINGSGVDVDTFSPAGKQTRAPVFLMVARLLREKGVLEYLEAAGITKQALPLAQFVLVGPSDNNPAAIGPELLRPYVEAGIIDYRGYVNNPLAVFREATIYVLPSYREGRPRTVLEAMACGLPVITTNVPGCRETVDDGVNGFVVPARDVAALSERMIRLGSDARLAREMGMASRRIAEEKYDVRLITKRILLVLT